MLNRDVILTEYRADARNFQKGARLYDQTLAKQQRFTNDRLGRIDARWERSTRSILATRTALTGLGGVVGGAAMLQLRNYAEGWRDVERRLQSIGVTSEAAQQGLVDLAIRTRSSIGGTAAAVQRMAKSTGDDIETTTRRVETLQKLLAAGGAGGTERASVSLQLGQALQSGVLSGDEFRSIRENAPVEFLDALAKAAGVTRKELKAVAEDQKLTSDVVLEALDNLATSADANFSAMAISGEEAITVLSAGLTAYAGKIDESIGATETINGAIASLGEYMAGSGEGAETMAAAIKVLAVTSLAAAGSRGVGALRTSILQSNVARSKALVSMRAQSRASMQAVIDANQELAAAKALRRERQIAHQARVFNNQKTVRSEQQLRAAIKAEEKATHALAGAQARATSTSRALTLAQNRMSVAFRAGTAAVRAFNGVMAFFGGPVGLAVTGLTLLAATLAQVNSPMERLDGVMDKAKTSLEQYAEAAKKVSKEQARMGGIVLAATEQMKAQSRVGMQESLKQVTSEFENVLEEIRSQSGGLMVDAIGSFRRTNGGFGGGPLAEGETLPQRIEKLNPVLGGIILKLEAMDAGSGNVAELAQAFDRVLSVGKEAFDVHAAWADSLSDPSKFEAGQALLISYAERTGSFREQLIAVNEAQSDLERNQAIQILATRIFDTAKASEALSATTQEGFAEMVRGGAEAGLMVQLLQAELEGSEEEASRLRDMLENGILSAEALGNTSISPPITAAADEAARLWSNLSAALNLSPELNARRVRGGIADGSIPPEAAQDLPPSELDKLYEKRRNTSISTRRSAARRKGGGGGGGGSGAAAAKDAERDLASARELLVENGQKALYIEQELNAERKRLQELLPSLIEMGLSRADAEAVLNSELERTEEKLNKVRTASEEAAHAFAKGILSDIRAADDLNDALGRISDRLLDLAMDRAFDMLADQFAKLGSAGGDGLGGGLGAIFGFLFPAVKAATGGLIQGPGTATSDSIPAWLSDGEYVVPAKSVTPSTLPYLEALRRGPVLPAFATGGLVGDSGGTSAPSGGMRVEIHNHASGAQVQATPSTDGQSLKVMIWDTVEDGMRAGRFDGAQRSRYGSRPVPRGA